MSVVQLVGAPTTLTWVSATDDAAAIAITKPDGTALSPAPNVTDSSTQHTSTITPDLPGRYVVLWSNAGGKHADVLDVWPEDPHYLVSRSEALERLGESATTAAPRFNAIPLYIASATAVVEYVTGPLIKASKTWSEVLMYPANQLVLPATDVTVTSVTVDGSSLVPNDYILDAPAGVIHARGQAFYDLVEVEYTAGGEEIPAQARQACLEIFAHMWQATRQDGRAEPYGEETQVTPMGFAIPRRALELLQSLPRPAGAA